MEKKLTDKYHSLERCKTYRPERRKSRFSKEELELFLEELRALEPRKVHYPLASNG